MTARMVITWVGLAISSVIYALVADRPLSWAADHSYWQATSLLALWLTCRYAAPGAR